MNDFRVPFLSLQPGDEAELLEAAIHRVVDRGWFVLGPEVEAFEQEFAIASGAAHAIGVGTGTDALALILRGLGIGPGDEVVTTPLSAAYTALAIQMVGARPVFADIDPERLTLDPQAVLAAISTRTAAVVPVHLYGQAADMAALLAVASRHGLPLVEDCCQAHLATADGRPVGTLGIAGAFSFYPTKNLGALGDGGLVVTQNDQLAERVRRLRNGGQADRSRHVDAGVNSRLDEIHAAVLRVRLAHLASWTTRRRALAARYRSRLAHAPVQLLRELDAGHVYHLFAIRSRDRTALMEHLGAAGIQTLIHYPIPIPRQPAFAATRPAACPVADAVCREIVSLPLHHRIGVAVVDQVADGVLSFTPARS